MFSSSSSSFPLRNMELHYIFFLIMRPPKTASRKMRLNLGLVDTWHSKIPASSVVTNRTFSVFEFGLRERVEKDLGVFDNFLLRPERHSAPFTLPVAGGGWIVAEKWKIDRPRRPRCLFDRLAPFYSQEWWGFLYRTTFPWHFQEK